MEMVVVMLLTGIVISISFKTFDILTKNYLVFKNNASSISRMALLDRLLTLDITKSKEVRKSEDGFDCLLEENKIQYLVYDEYIVRIQSAVSDTFEIAASDAVYKFQHKSSAYQGALMDELGFIFTYKGEALHFYYRKNYGADVLMREESAASPNDN